MRLIHTADWHLGQLLHDFPREHEHAAFLAWLLEAIGRERADALIVAGDIFDSANPPATALKAWFGFLTELHRRHPRLTTVIVGGNHDSASRLEAPLELLREFGTHVVGGLPRDPHGRLDLERLLVPLADAAGRPAAWVAAVPYLRPADLPAVEDGDPAPQVEGMRRIYAEAIAAARAKAGFFSAVVATGHCTMTGGALSEVSERKIQGGNRWPLPADVFPEDVAYVALGHLHLRQEVDGRKHVRYSGSPIPLSLAEADYPHEVVVVDFDGPRCAGIRSLRVPRTVGMLRIPAEGAAPPAPALMQLRNLPAAPPGKPAHELDWLEVRVLVDQPEPGLPAQVALAMKGRAARLAKLTVEYRGTGKPLPEATRAAALEDLSPEEVFRKRHRRQYDSDPDPDLMAAFLELLEEVRREAEEAP